MGERKQEYSRKDRGGLRRTLQKQPRSRVPSVGQGSPRRVGAAPCLPAEPPSA